jgi:hypothetical protein
VGTAEIKTAKAPEGRKSFELENIVGSNFFRPSGALILWR